MVYQTCWYITSHVSFGFFVFILGVTWCQRAKRRATVYFYTLGNSTPYSALQTLCYCSLCIILMNVVLITVITIQSHTNTHIHKQ